MYKYLFLSLLVSVSNVLFAQKYSEIKFDVLGLSERGNQAELSYERALSKKISLTAGVAYGFNRMLSYPNGLQDTILSTIIIPQLSRKHSNNVSCFVKARYYHIPNNGIDRVFLGAGLRGVTNVWIEEGYPFDSSPTWIELVGELGYKFVIGDRIPLELGINLSLEIRGPDNLINADPEFNMLFGKVGYRFGKRKEE